MKIYIVYEGEFSTNKPREHMAEPTISLVTSDEEKADHKLDELWEEYKGRGFDMYHNGDSFSYNDAYSEYGQVGILVETLEE